MLQGFLSMLQPPIYGIIPGNPAYIIPFGDLGKDEAAPSDAMPDSVALSPPVAKADEALPVHPLAEAAKPEVAKPDIDGIYQSGPAVAASAAPLVSVPRDSEPSLKDANVDDSNGKAPNGKAHELPGPPPPMQVCSGLLTQFHHQKQGRLHDSCTLEVTLGEHACILATLAEHADQKQGRLGTGCTPEVTLRNMLASWQC